MHLVVANATEKMKKRFAQKVTKVQRRSDFLVFLFFFKIKRGKSTIFFLIILQNICENAYKAVKLNN